MRYGRVDADHEVEASDQRSRLSERSKLRGNVAQHRALLKLREARPITVTYIMLQREEVRVGVE